MILHTLTSQTTDPIGRGTLIGERFGPQVRLVADRYLAHFAALGLTADQVRAVAERSRAALRAWHPPLAAESDACADAAGLDHWVIAAIGARTEVIAAAEAIGAAGMPRAGAIGAGAAGGGECSTAVFAPVAGAPETVQTWDWHARLVPEALLHELAPAPGRAVKVFTEFGIPGKIGVNDAGLGLHLNMLRHVADDDSGGVPVHAIARRVLDECDTIEQAIAVAGSARVSASTSLTVVTGPPGSPARTASLELSPAGLAVVSPNPDGWLLHTNHFLDPGLAAGEAVPADSTTAERLDHLTRVREQLPGLAPVDRARRLCGSQGADAVVCVHPDQTRPVHEQVTTMLTICLEAAETALDYAVGDPASAAASGFGRF